MREIPAGTKYGTGRCHTYYVGGIQFPWFVIGALEDNDEFFLTGIEPDDGEFGHLSGCILGADGDILFRLNRNRLDVNPRDCSKIDIGPGSYEIRDFEGNVVLKVETEFNQFGDDSHELVTKITGTFYGKNRRQIAVAGDTLHVDTKIAGGSLHGGYSGVQRLFLDAVIESNGAINQLRSVNWEGKEFELDGNYFYDSSFVNCKIIIRSGQFRMFNQRVIAGCGFHLQPPATAIKDIVDIMVLTALGLELPRYEVNPQPF